MNTTMQDVIEREITVRAPRERVFNAITDPAQIVGWFPDAVEGNIRPKERAVFDFGSDMKVEIFVVAVEPFDYFAYRWTPGSDEALKGASGDVLGRPNTLVEFRLEDTTEGTIVKLKESGFASLPAENIRKALAENTDGWEYMMARLEKLLNQE